MKKQTVVLALLVLLPLRSAQALKFVAYGDTRSRSSVHQGIIDRIAAFDPGAIISTGDLWDGYSTDVFRSILTSHANIASLLNSNLYLAAKGNHESPEELVAFTPPIVRPDYLNQGQMFSFTVGNCFFVCTGQHTWDDWNTSWLPGNWLEEQLQSPEARNASWRFIYSHRPVYSAGRHGASGKPRLEALCDQYNVNMVFSGHDHIYERTRLIYNGAVESSDDEVVPYERGTVYVVTGGGGAYLYTSGTDWWTAFNSSIEHYCELTATDDRLELVARGIDGAALDVFALERAAVGLKPASCVTDGGKWLSRVELSLGADRMTLHMPSALHPGPQVRFCTPTGRTLFSRQITPGERQVEMVLSGLPAGMYMAVLRAGGMARPYKVPVLPR